MNGILRKGGVGFAPAQVLVLFAVMIFVLIIFIGLAVDGGNIYITKATLSKAVDAAALTGVRAMYQGEDVASALAKLSFAANFHGGGDQPRDATVDITYTTDNNNNKQINIAATTVVNTYFIRLIPRFTTFTISGGAQATRAKLIMDLVLDRSGSMQSNGGAAALPGAVTAFVNYFDDTCDTIGSCSFASAATVDVGIGHPFKSAIKSSLNSMPFGGRTFGVGGLSNGYQQITSVPVLPTENVIKICIYFTDGFPNTFQDAFAVVSKNRLTTNMMTLNLGQGDPAVGVTSPVPPGVSYSFMSPATGADYSFGTNWTAPTTFTSILGGSKSITANNWNIWWEGHYRAQAVANQMRDAGITIYCIGLGDNMDKDFLRILANDPGASSYNTNQPVGMAVFAPDASQLQSVFQLIASKILARLTQ